MLSYLKARASELSSIFSASGATGIIGMWLLGKIDGKSALAGLAVAAVAYVMPQDKGLAQTIADAVLAGTKKVLLPLALVAGLGWALEACTSQELQTAGSDLQLACSAAQGDLAAAEQATGGGANKTVQNIAAYVNGGCPVASGVVTVAANVAADPTSLTWLQGLSAAAKAAVAAAPAPAAAAPAAAQ